MRTNTLTRQLFLRVAPTVLVAILLVGIGAYKSATTQINHVYDAQLISSANMMWLVVEDEMKDAGPRGFRRIRKIDLSINNQRALNRFASDYVESRMFRVLKSHRLAMMSDKALGPEVPQQHPGFSNVETNGEHWRVYDLPIPGTAIAIEAGERVALRRSLVANILLELSVPLMLLVPLLAALIWFGIGSGLNTVRALIEQIRSRSPDDLSHLNLAHVPQDLRPLGQAINQLLTKLEHSFTAEKRFSEHAAHHLRTPLATLKLQLQLLEHARDAAESQSLMSNLLTSIERASRLVGQLLTSTRVSHQPIVRVPLSLPAIAAMLMGEIAPLAANKNITLALENDSEVAVMADETLLRLLIGNLLENAVKYTPDSGRVTLHIDQDGGMARCRVCDTGPGIPEADRTLVFERFYRVGTPKAEGTGLGLAIVAEIVSRLSGSIQLRAGPGASGLEVEIRLPIAA